MAWLTLVRYTSQKLLNLSDSSSRVESFRAGLSAVHNCVTSVDTERISELIQSLSLMTVPAVNYPSVSLHDQTPEFKSVLQANCRQNIYRTHGLTNEFERKHARALQSHSYDGLQNSTST